LITGLDHVRLGGPLGCEEQARAFYGGLLGLREIDQPPLLAARGGVWWELADGRQLHIGADADFAAAAKAHPALALADGSALDALAERLADAGCEPRWDSELPGARRFYLNDPFGNRLELIAWDR
jgi:catechol 2,3-dioxygenase-like lactoylglutathione lyase family enzyme